MRRPTGLHLSRTHTEPEGDKSLKTPVMKILILSVNKAMASLKQYSRVYWGHRCLLAVLPWCVGTMVVTRIRSWSRLEGCRGDLTIHFVTASVCRSPQTAAVPALSSLCLRHKSENKTREINRKFNMKTECSAMHLWAQTPLKHVPVVKVGAFTPPLLSVDVWAPAVQISVWTGPLWSG